MAEMSKSHMKEWYRDHDGWNIGAGMEGELTGTIRERPGTQNSGTRAKISLFYSSFNCRRFRG